MTNHLKIRATLAAVTLATTACGRADVFSDVPEAAGYTLAYSLAIGDTNQYTIGVPYGPGNASSIADNSFSRVGYYLQLQSSQPNSPLQYVYASFDAATFSRQASRIGVPTAASGGYFQQSVQNMNVVSNVSGIVTGSGISTGNVEFWPLNYTTGNSANVPHASNSAYDFGDTPDSGGNYGSMQIHNYGSNAKQTILAFNNWNNNSTSDVGIGNDPNTSRANYNPDFTFAGNAGTYSIKNLEVVVGGHALAPLPPAVKIMPLGDSITDGVAVNGGYRLPLQNLLNGKINTDFVGSLSDNSAGMTDPQHEGHSGYTISGLQGLPIADRINTYQPDVTLLHIGTNDISQGHTLAQMQMDLETLITTIEGITLNDGLKTKLLVAQIIPRGSSLADNATTIAYNQEVAALVTEHEAWGEPVYLVDQYDALQPNSTDLSDGIHPTATGYEKMAETWFPAIEAVVPEPATPMLVAMVGVFLATLRPGRTGRHALAFSNR